MKRAIKLNQSSKWIDKQRIWIDVAAIVDWDSSDFLFDSFGILLNNGGHWPTLCERICSNSSFKKKIQSTEFID